MKVLMKKVGGTEQSEQQVEEEEDTPKKVRNRPLFHVKVSILHYLRISVKLIKNTALSFCSLML